MGSVLISPFLWIPYKVTITFYTLVSLNLALVFLTLICMVVKS